MKTYREWGSNVDTARERRLAVSAIWKDNDKMLLQWFKQQNSMPITRSILQEMANVFSKHMEI